MVINECISELKLPNKKKEMKGSNFKYGLIVIVKVIKGHTSRNRDWFPNFFEWIINSSTINVTEHESEQWS